jgi:hypothetical protein
MAYMPDKTPVSRIPRFSFWSWLTVLLVAVSLYIIIKVHTIWSFLVAGSFFLLAFMIQKVLRAKTSQMTVQVSVLGVFWFHPGKGGGTLRWGNIGAVSVKERRAGAELALILTPKDLEEGSAMIVESSDLASSPGEGLERIRELAAEIITKMPADTVLDRPTRAWAERMGLSRGKG